MEYKRVKCCGCFGRDKRDQPTELKFKNSYSSVKGDTIYDCNCSFGSIDCCHGDLCTSCCYGEGTLYICGRLIISLLLLLPITLFAFAACPFWLCAQYISSKLGSTVKFYVIVIIFIIALIIPFVVWFLLEYILLVLLVDGIIYYYIVFLHRICCIFGIYYGTFFVWTLCILFFFFVM